MSTTSVSQMHVAIVGGGPGGLSLAAILKKLQIRHTVFELDASRFARSQGGTLDIHKDSGRLALEEASLLDEFKKHMRVDATELYVRDKTGAVLMHDTEEGEEDPARPEIDRARLRDILLDALEPETIKWGKKVSSVSYTDGEGGRKFSLDFADGTSAGGFDILVGADGVWSKVRSLRSDVLPPYSGAMCVSTSISSFSDKYPQLAAFVGKGSSMCISGKDLVVAQKNGDGSVKTYIIFPGPENWKDVSGIDWSKPQKEVLDNFMETYYSDWSDETKQLIALCDEGELAVRPLYQYPPGYSFEKKLAGVTLLGDAAHVMTPLAGVGVNLALHDAFDLAHALRKIEAGTSAEQAIGEYEAVMFERATKNVTKTQQNQNLFLKGLEVKDIMDGLAQVFGGGEEH
ncbi:hypothetical protein D9611_012632 [Ephemerocybe angulata]|uniref:FAD-binding domain-containing protein n=1 Tax=Ephemerocybe angulata TaxID=980116 RepID=A0A8H5AUM4_9AGAR|nr:hypothetical protein D9611_012632 [Tulosesus angulatus]